MNPERYEVAAIQYRTLQKELAALNRKLGAAAQVGEQRLAAARTYATFLRATVNLLKATTAKARIDRKVSWYGGCAVPANLSRLEAVAEDAYLSFLESAADLEARLAPLRSQVSDVIGQLQERHD